MYTGTFVISESMSYFQEDLSKLNYKNILHMGNVFASSTVVAQKLSTKCDVCYPPQEKICSVTWFHTLLHQDRRCLLQKFNRRLIPKKAYSVSPSMPLAGDQTHTNMSCCCCAGKWETLCATPHKCQKCLRGEKLLSSRWHVSRIFF